MKIGPKGTIGIVASERNNFAWDFIASLIGLKQRMGNEVSITCAQSGNVPDGRNLILDIAKKNGSDYCLMIDSDMTFPSDGILKLKNQMELFDAHIGCGLYFGTHRAIVAPMAYNEENGKQVNLTDWTKTQYIASCGMGFTLITKELFDLRFRFEPLIGEDHLFCKEARDKGYKVILDSSVKCGHLRTLPIDENLARFMYSKNMV